MHLSRRQAGGVGAGMGSVLLGLVTIALEVAAHDPDVVSRHSPNPWGDVPEASEEVAADAPLTVTPWEDEDPEVFLPSPLSVAAVGGGMLMLMGVAGSLLLLGSGE